jgi:hypothetical protein
MKIPLWAVLPVFNEKGPGTGLFQTLMYGEKGKKFDWV